MDPFTIQYSDLFVPISARQILDLNARKLHTILLDQHSSSINGNKSNVPITVIYYRVIY